MIERSDEQEIEGQTIEKIAQIVLEKIDDRDETKQQNKFAWMSQHSGILAIFLSIIALCGQLSEFLLSSPYPFQPERQSAHTRETMQRQKEQWRIGDDVREKMTTLLELGNSLLDEGKYDDAKARFEKVKELHSNSMEAHMGLFKVDVFKRINSKDYDLGVIKKQIEYIQKQNKDDPHAYVLLGNVYCNIGEFEEAKNNYLKVINERVKILGKKGDDQKVGIALAHTGLGNIYDREGETEEAIRHYEKAVKLSAWNRQFLDNLAYAYYKIGDYQKALDKYDLVLKLDSNYLLPFYIIAKIHMRTGDHKRALRWYKMIVEQLENKEITKLSKNSRIWYFESADGPVWLYALVEKRCHAWYCTALTMHLSDRKDTHVFIEKARKLNLGIERHNRIMKIVFHDLTELEKRQPKYSDKLQGFKVLLGRQLSKKSPNEDTFGSYSLSSLFFTEGWR